jgi:hypothetical protein
MNWTKRLNIKTFEPSKVERSDCGESGLNLAIELGEAELGQVAGGVTETGIVHRF